MVLTTQVVGVTVHLMQSVPCRGGAWYWRYTSGRGYGASDAECTMQKWRMVLATQVVEVTVHLMQSVLCRGGAWY